MKHSFSTSLLTAVLFGSVGVHSDSLLSTPVQAQCTANWSSQSGTNSCTLHFTSTSTGTNNNTFYYWNFGDGQTSYSYQNPVHTYSAAGTYTVCLHLSSMDSTCSSYLCKTVTVQCGASGIAFSEQMNDVSLSVNNPVFSSADIHYFIPSGGNIELALFDALGNRVSVLETGSKSAGVHSYELNATSYSKGMYFIRLGWKWAAINRKIVIVR